LLDDISVMLMVTLSADALANVYFVRIYESISAMMEVYMKEQQRR
jgi:hypothetical protein